MAGRQNGSEWLERVRSTSAVLEDEDRARVAAMTVSERLAHGVELSKLAIRLRDAFREQRRVHG